VPATYLSRSAFEPGVDRTGEDVDVRLGRCRPDERREPAGQGVDVVVDEDDQVREGLPQAGIPGGVQAMVGAQGVVGRAMAGGDRLARTWWAVLDDEQFGSVGRRLGGDRVEGDVEIVGPPECRDDDRRVWCERHQWPE